MGRIAGRTSLLVCLVFILSIQVVYSSGSNITKNGVTLTKPEMKVQGVVSIEGKTVQKKIKIVVKKNNKETWYNADLENGRFDEAIWLTDGLGKYQVTVMVNEYDRKYSYGPSISIENVGEVNKNLVPAKYIESDDPVIKDAAAKILKNCSSDIEKAEAIYEWVVKNIEYDYKKLEKHKAGDYDNQYGALHTYMTKKGVCFDFATLTAALGRSAGLQVKVAEGLANTDFSLGLHAWNEIYITELDKWIHVDTTFGSVSGQNFFDTEADEGMYELSLYR